MTSHDFNKNVFKDNHFVNIGMSSSNSKNKGKAPIQGFPQKMHEGASSGKEPRKATSLQTVYPETVTYSSGYMAITLQEVKNKALQFRRGIYKDLPPSTKFVLDNLQRAFTQNHPNLLFVSMVGSIGFSFNFVFFRIKFLFEHIHIRDELFCQH